MLSLDRDLRHNTDVQHQNWIWLPISVRKPAITQSVHYLIAVNVAASVLQQTSGPRGN